MRQYTQEAYDDLLASVSQCKESLAAAKMRMGKTAQEDTWHDNAAFDQAQEDVRSLTAQLRNLEHQLAGAKVVSRSASTVIGVGSVVRVMYDDYADDQETLTLDGRAISNAPGDMTHVSTSSPIGAALLGRQVGDLVTYIVPSGQTCSLRVLEVC